MATVTRFIDEELLVAGDNGDDESYGALVDLRQAVVKALTTTGATLPTLETFAFRAPMSALAMANRLYRDTNRTDELIQQANPIHPAFMPTTVKALAR
jgi:prophage DNA circulation protein